MKYMGSKSAMLKRGLGELILIQALSANRVVDLFCGSGAVVWFAAEKTNRRVLAFDLQHYAVSLADAVIARTEPIDITGLKTKWFEAAQSWLGSLSFSIDAKELDLRLRAGVENAALVLEARKLCQQALSVGAIWSMYGGHYFSPLQALIFDALRATIPTNAPIASVALASLIVAASDCAASPGHTAQPFQPTKQAIRFLVEAWQRDPFYYCQQALQDISSRVSKVQGTARLGDARIVSAELEEGDLVIIDPPYSNVQYSRFYHVLETIAQGTRAPVQGAGRYPPHNERPQSDYSLKSRSETALIDLLRVVSERRASAILTFPAGISSNGLTGEKVMSIAKQFFIVEEHIINGKFSTLGGNGLENHRPARTESRELVLLMRPS